MKVKFLCQRFPHLSLVFSPEDAKEVGGRTRRIPGVHLDFKPNPQGVGELVLEKQDHIEFVKEHSYFKEGHIIIGDSVSSKKLSGPGKGPKVKQGSLSAEVKPPKDENPAPDEPAKAAPKAARVPKRAGKKGRKK